MSLEVAYDAGPLLDPPTGVGRYVRELGHALEAQGVSLVRYAVSARGATNESIARWRVPARVARTSWRRWGWPPLERLTGSVDVVHGTNFVLPATRTAPGVVTVHDLSFHRDDAFPGASRLRALVPWAITRARKVLVPTQAVKDEVIEVYGADGDAVTVTPEGVSPLFFGASPLASAALARWGVSGPYVLAAGTIEPRKNLQRLLQAWALVADELREWTLILAGPPGWGPGLRPAPGVVPVGWVGDETLPGLLAGASLFCYPSLYEGFGLPPLEAMAAGTPVVAGGYSAAPEVLGEAALLVDPTDVEALADAVRRIATDESLRRSLVTAGRARASAYTWERTARATVAAYEDAMS